MRQKNIRAKKNRALANQEMGIISIVSVLGFIVWILWPGLRAPREILVGDADEDSSLQALMQNVFSLAGTNGQSPVKTTLVNYPEGAYVYNPSYWYTPASSLIRTLLSRIFTGTETNLLLVSAGIVITAIYAWKLAMTISRNYLLVTLAVVLFSTIPFRMHWLSAAPDLDALPFLLAYSFHARQQAKSRFRIELSLFIIGLFGVLYHPWIGILLLIFQAGNLLSLLRKTKLLQNPHLFGLMGGLLGFVLITAISNYSPSIDWTYGAGKVEENNLFKFAFLNPDSRSFINPIIIVGVTVWILSQLIRSKNHYFEKIESQNIMACVYSIAFSFVLFGPFKFHGWDLPAYYVSELIPQIRNGIYAMLLIQFCLVYITLEAMSKYMKSNVGLFLPGLNSVAIFSLIVTLLIWNPPKNIDLDREKDNFPQSMVKPQDTKRWMQMPFGDLSLRRVQAEILKLPPGPILVFPYGSILSDSGLNCFFAVSIKHPLINSCSPLFQTKKNLLMDKIRENTDVCNQVNIARREGIRTFIFLDYRNSTSSQKCVKSLTTNEKSSPQVYSISLSTDIYLIHL